ncbi:MAG: hypothetical protein WD469_04265 [Paenibacillaceae bacterium]
MNGNTPRDSNLENKQMELDIRAIQVESVPTLPSAKKGTASSLRIRYKDFGELTLADYEIFSKLPAHPFWSQVEKLVDFSFSHLLSN